MKHYKIKKTITFNTIKFGNMYEVKCRSCKALMPSVFFKDKKTKSGKYKPIRVCVYCRDKKPMTIRK